MRSAAKLAGAPASNAASAASGWGAVLLAVSLFAMAAFSWQGLLSLPIAWTRPEYSHGYLIPLIAIYLFVRKADMTWDWRGDRRRWPGLFLGLLALVLASLGNATQIPDLVTYGFILFLFALALIGFGWRHGALFWVPVVYLCFMLPLPNFIYWKLSIALQLYSSQIGVWLIQLFGVPVYLEGNVIDLGVYQLQVAEACSGLRYLFPLASFGFLFAALYRGPVWHKIVLFLSAGPVTVAMNSLRIGIIGLLVDRYGIDQAEGFLHTFEGWVIFAACIALLLLEALILQRLQARPLPLSETLDLQMVPLARQGRAFLATPSSTPLVLLTALTLIAAAIWVAAPQRQFARAERLPFAAFPLEIGGWHGFSDELSQDVEAVLGADDYFMATYAANDGEHGVNLFMAYYHRLTGGSGIHSPEVCIPAGGWEVSEWKQVPVTLAGAGGARFNVNRAIIQRGLSRQVVYYWFEQHGRRNTSDYASKFYTIIDSISKGRTDAGLIRLVTAIGEGESDADADARLQSYIADLLPHVADYIPQ